MWENLCDTGVKLYELGVCNDEFWVIWIWVIGTFLPFHHIYSRIHFLIWVICVFYSISSKSFGYGLLSHIVTADMAVISDAKPSVASTRRRFSQIPISFIVIVITMLQMVLAFICGVDRQTTMLHSPVISADCSLVSLQLSPN